MPGIRQLDADAPMFLNTTFANPVGHYPCSVRAGSSFIGLNTDIPFRRVHRWDSSRRGLRRQPANRCRRDREGAQGGGTGFYELAARMSHARSLLNDPRLNRRPILTTMGHPSWFGADGAFTCCQATRSKY